MARRTMSMTEIQEIIYRHTKGISIKQITQSLGIARNTVREIIRLGREHGLRQGNEGDIDLIAEKVRQARQRPSINKGTTESILKAHHKQLEAWWQCPHMTATQMTRLLAETQGITINDRSMRRYVSRYLKETTALQTTVHMETPPGQQGQVDFGSVGMMRDPKSGKLRKAYAFVMILSYSRYRFVRFVFQQDVATWIDCHIRAFHFFGGVPLTLVIDNLKAGVIAPDIYDPTLNRSYSELERYYGFVVDPAKVRTPQHKGKVERSIPIVRQQVLAGRSFKDSEEANAYALQWCRHEIASRVTRTTGQTPWERFEVEKNYLQPLPQEDYECALWQRAKVHRDQHVVFEGSFYSVPCAYAGQGVWIRATQRMVEIYNQEYQRIKGHVRTFDKGQWITDVKDYPEQAQAFLEKDTQACLEEAQAIGPSTSALISQVLAHPTLLSQRKAHAILQFAIQYGKQRLEGACKRALAFDNHSYRSLKHILKDGLDQAEAQEDAKKILPAYTLKESSYLRHPSEFVNSHEEARV